MRYMLFVCTDPAITATAEEDESIPSAVEAWAEEMEGRGVRLEGHVFAPAGEAKTIRLRDDEVRITDGTAASEDERIAGFNVLECRDLGEALEVAAKHPMARFGMLELRPYS